MRKVDRVHRSAAALGCTVVQADDAVEAILATIKAALQQGEPVILRRFGTWHVRSKQARVGRNPKTGSAAAVAARRIVRLTVGQVLQQGVAGATTPADGADGARRRGGERRNDSGEAVIRVGTR